MSESPMQEELDVGALSAEALDTLAARPCNCRRTMRAERGGDFFDVSPAYRCLAHRAIDELERRERCDG